MALTRAQIQTAFQNSLGRAASTNEENSYFSVSQSGALSDATIYTTISNSQEANLNADPVVRFYQAAFGRVPDQAGLDNATDYVRAFTPTAQTYQNLANQFVQSQEFINRFGAGTSVDAGYVQALYSTILGRQATAAEIDGYVSGAAGYTTRGGVLYAISQSQEAISASDAAVNGFLNNAAQGTAVYAGTLYTAQNGQPNQPGQNGQNFVFTTGVDNLTGGAGNDTFTADNTGTNKQLTAVDTVNGGAGTDTLRVFLAAGDAALPAATLNSIENISINGGAITALNVSGIAGVTSVTVDAPVADTAETITVANQAVTLANFATANATTTTIASTTDTVQNLTLSKVANVTAGAALNTIDISGANVATLNLTSTGGANNVILTDTGAALRTLNISGDQKLTITSPDAVTTINASTNSAGVTATVGNGAVSVTGGSGNDKFVFTGTTLTTADTVVGGAGTDTISVVGADFSTVTAGGTLAALNSKVTGVETLEFTGTAATTINGNTFTNTEITKILFNTTTGADTVDAAGSARTYAVGEINTGALTLNGKADVTSFNVSLEGITGNGGDVGALTANFTNNTAAQVGTGTINLASIGTNDAANPNTTGAITGQSNGAALTSTVVNVTGSHDLTIGSLGTAGSINASAFTGKLIATGSTGQDTITGGSGADTINATAGGDTYTGGAGNDTFVFTAAAQASNTALTTISDFTSGSDKLNVSTLSTGAGTFNATAVNVSAAPDFQGALNLAAAGTTAGASNYFQFGGNTYVVVDNTAAPGGFVAGTDGVIKLTGLVTLTAADVIA